MSLMDTSDCHNHNIGLVQCLRYYNMVIRQMALLHTNQHYITLHQIPLSWPDHRLQAIPALPHCCCIKTASRRQPIITAQLPRLQSTATGTHTHTAASDLKIISRIEVIRYQRRPRQILQVDLLLLAGPEDGGSEAGEATTGTPRLRIFPDSVWAGKSIEEHQFDLGRNPPGLENWNLYFRNLIA